MSRETINKATLQAYRAGVLLGIGGIMWLMTHFVTRSEYETAWRAHDKLRDETLERLIQDTASVRAAVTRIETLLLNRQRADSGSAMGSRKDQ